MSPWHRCPWASASCGVLSNCMFIQTLHYAYRFTANKMDVLGLLGHLESVQRACATFGTAYPADNSTPYVYKLYTSQCRCFSFTNAGVNVTQRLFQIYVGLLAWKDRVSTATPGSDPCSVSCSRVDELQSAGTP
jgi:hypothetical protein